MFKVKRLLAIVLSILMLIQALPMAALADEWKEDRSADLYGAKATYTVNFVDKDGNTLLNKNQLIEAGSSAVAPFVPDVEGYEFTGWESNLEGSTVELPTGNTTFKATYSELIEYIIQVDYVFASDVTVAAKPSIVYEFSGKDVPADGITVTTPTLNGFQPSAASVSFTAEEIKANTHKQVVFTGTPTTYTVKHMLQDVEGDNYSTVKETETIDSEVGRTTTAEAKTYAGFTPVEIKQVTVEADAKTVVEVKYDRNLYALTFDSDGGTPVEGGLYRHGATIDKLPGASTMSKVGFTFGGWTLDGASVTSVTMPTNDITLKAVWTNNKTASYTVRYWVQNLDDDKNAEDSKKSYDFLKEVTGNTYDVGKTPTKSFSVNVKKLLTSAYEPDEDKRDTFFKFNDKKSDVNGSGVVKTTAEPIKADGTTVYDIYIDRRLVTFTFNKNSNNGGGKITRTGLYGQTFVQAGYDIDKGWPAPAAKYIWQGTSGIQGLYWTYLNGFTNTTMDSVSVTFSEVYRNSTKKVYQYVEKLNWTSEEDRWIQADLFESLKGNFNLTAKFEPGFSLYGYKVDTNSARTDDGKFKKQTTMMEVDETKFSDNIRIYHNRNKFNVSFTNCKTNPSAMTYWFEESLSSKYLPGNEKNTFKLEPPANVDSDFVFAGWYKEAAFENQVTDGKGNVLNDAKMPAGHMLLHAKWKAPEYTVTFYNNKSASDTSTHASVKVTKYDTIEGKMPADPTRTGYTFGGWYVNRNCTIGFLDNTTVIKDISVYAKWIPAGDPVYTVKYQDEEGNTLAADKKVTKPLSDLNKTFTEQALNISGYSAQKNSISFVLNYGSEIIFVYSKLDPWTLKVNYLEKGTNNKLAEPKTAVVTEKTIVEFYKAITNYNVETEILVATKDNAEITFWYTKVEKKPVTIEYYFQNDNGEYPSTPNNTAPYGEVPKGHTVTIDPAGEKTNNGKDYVYDADPSKTTAIVTDNGATLKVYYKLDSVVVTYNKGAHGNLAGQDVNGNVVHPNLQIGEATPDEPAVTPDSGYYFIGWNPEVTPTVTGTVTYVAQYQPIQNASLVVADKEVTYNGETQTSDKPVQESTLKDGHKWEYTYTPATGENVGTTTGSFTNVKIVDANGNDVSNQYNITTNPGDLIIKPAPVTVTINGNKDEEVYNDSEQSVTGYSVASISNPLYKETDIAFSGAAVAAGTNVGTYPMNLSKNQFTNENGNFVVEFVVNDGELKITPAEVTVTAANKTKVYGAADPDLTATVSGLKGNDTEDMIDYVLGRESGENVGKYPITPSGDEVQGNYIVKYVPGELEITRATVTVTADDKTKVYGEADPDLTATVSGLKNGDTASVIDYDLSRTPGEEVGEYPITPSGEEVQGNYNVIYVPGELKITKVTNEIIITAASDAKVYDGTPLTNAGYTYTPGILVEGDVLTAVVEGTITNVGTAANNVVSYKVMRGDKDVTSFYSFGTSVPGELEVTPAKVTVTADDKVKAFGEADPKLTATVSGLKNGEAASLIQYTLSRTSGENVGTYPITPSGNEKQGNYIVEYVPGKLEITPIDEVVVIITGHKAEKVYNGSEQSVSGYEVSISNPLYKASDFTFSGTDVAKGTDVDTYPMGLNANQFTNTNTNFKKVTFKVYDGELKITPKPVTVTITGNTDTKYYTGEEQKVTGYDVNIVDPLYKEADFTFSGDATAKGTDVGNHPMGLKDNQFKNNNGNFAVTFKVTDGWLKIIKEGLVITADSANKVYDGTALTKNTYTASGLKDGDSIVSVQVSGSQTDAGSSANVASGAVIKDASGKDVTANYDITYVPGTLTVTQKPLTITAGSATKEYDGTPLTNNSYTAGETAKGDIVASTLVVGSQTYVGSSANTASNAVVKNASGKDVTKNYAITYVPGTLTVTGDPVIADKTTPAVESPYKLGDTVPFQITVKNIKDQEMKNVIVEDESAIIVAGTGYVVENGIAKIARIPVGGSVVVNAQHVVTEADILAGTYENTAKVTADDKVLYVSREVEVEDPAPHLSLTKITTNNPNKDVIFDIGDVIEYEIKVVNDGNLTVTDIVVTDEMTGDVWTAEALKPGESISFYSEYVVTEGDLFRDTVVNVATATGKSEDPENPDVPTEPGRTEDETADPKPGFTVVKAITDTPENGLDYYEVGETVDFSVTVTNYGNVTLNNVTIGEVLADAKFVGGPENTTISEDGASAVIASIDPARKGNNVVVLEAQYTIKESDLGNEDLENMLTGKGTYDNPEDPSDPPIPVDPDPIDPVPIPVDAATKVNVTKIWNDQDNAFNTRANSIEVTLYQNVAGEKIAYKTATLTADAWSCSFEMLPAHKMGELIEYTVEEAAMVDANGVVIYVPTYDKAETETGTDWTITNTLQQYTLTVRYWYEEIGGREAAKTFVRDYYYGESYKVTSPRITGYSVDKSVVSGVITADAEHDVIYTPIDYRLTVNYIYEDGTTAARTHRETLRYKDKYGVDSPAISGYVASVKRVAGTMPGRDLKYTVIYVPETVIIEEYGVPLNLGNVVMNVGDCFE